MDALKHHAVRSLDDLAVPEAVAMGFKSLPPVEKGGQNQALANNHVGFLTRAARLARRRAEERDSPVTAPPALGSLQVGATPVAQQLMTLLGLQQSSAPVQPPKPPPIDIAAGLNAVGLSGISRFAWPAVKAVEDLADLLRKRPGVHATSPLLCIVLCVVFAGTQV